MHISTHNTHTSLANDYYVNVGDGNNYVIIRVYTFI